MRVKVGTPDPTEWTGLPHHQIRNLIDFSLNSMLLPQLTEIPDFNIGGPYLNLLREQVLSHHFTEGFERERIQWIQWIHATAAQRLELNWKTVFEFTEFGGGRCNGCKKIFLGKDSLESHDVDFCKIQEIHEK